MENKKKVTGSGALLEPPPVEALIVTSVVPTVMPLAPTAENGSPETNAHTLLKAYCPVSEGRGLFKVNSPAPGVALKPHPGRICGANATKTKQPFWPTRLDSPASIHVEVTPLVISNGVKLRAEGAVMKSDEVAVKLND